MVHWIWLIVVFYIGMGFGVFLVALLRSAKGGRDYDY